MAASWADYDYDCDDAENVAVLVLGAGSVGGRESFKGRPSPAKGRAAELARHFDDVASAASSDTARGSFSEWRDVATPLVSQRGAFASHGFGAPFFAAPAPPSEDSDDDEHSDSNDDASRGAIAAANMDYLIAAAAADGACEFSQAGVLEGSLFGAMAWRVDRASIEKLELQALVGESVLALLRESSGCTIFHWVSSTASRRAVVAAAYRSTMLAKIVRDAGLFAVLRREAEGEESDAFLALGFQRAGHFNRSAADNAFRFSENYEEDEFDRFSGELSAFHSEGDLNTFSTRHVSDRSETGDGRASPRGHATRRLQFRDDDGNASPGKASPRKIASPGDAASPIEAEKPGEAETPGNAETPGDAASRLFEVRTRAGVALGACLAEVEPSRLALLPARTLLLSAPLALYCWRGGAAPLRDRAAAFEALQVLRRERLDRGEPGDVVNVQHGDEPHDFWFALDKKAPPAASKARDDEAAAEAAMAEAAETAFGGSSVDSLAEEATNAFTDALATELLGDGCHAAGAFYPSLLKYFSANQQVRRVAPAIVKEDNLQGALWQLLSAVLPSSPKKLRAPTRLRGQFEHYPSWSHHHAASLEPARLYRLTWHRRTRLARVAAVEPVAGSLYKGALNSKTACVVHTGSATYAWFGRESGAACRAAALALCADLGFERPDWALRNVHEVSDGFEPAPFRSQFVDWIDAEALRVVRSAMASALKHSTSWLSPKTRPKQLRSSDPLGLAFPSPGQGKGLAFPGQDSWQKGDSQIASPRSHFGPSSALARTRRRSSSLVPQHDAACRSPRRRRSDSWYLTRDHFPEPFPFPSSEAAVFDAVRVMLDATWREEADENDEEEDKAEHYLVVWRIESQRLVLLPPEQHGHFESRHSYAVLHGSHEDDEDAKVGRTAGPRASEAQSSSADFEGAAGDGGRDSEAADLNNDSNGGDAGDIANAALRHRLRPARRQRCAFALFFWSGDAAPHDDRARWLLQHRKSILDDWKDELSIAPPPRRVDVEELREPKAFLKAVAAAAGGVVVHTDAGDVLGFGSESPSSPTSKVHLYQVRHRHAVEVAPLTSSLCAADVFLCCRRRDAPDRLSRTRAKAGAKAVGRWAVWVWVGSAAPLPLRRVAARLVLKLLDFHGIDDEATQVRVLDEFPDGAQHDARYHEFWAALRGPARYADHALHARRAVFFKVGRPASANGDPKNDDVVLPAGLELTQRDLGALDAFVVDAHFGVLVWLGKDVSPRRAAFARGVADAYAAAKRTPPLAVAAVTEGGEGPQFRALFHGWKTHSAARPRPRLDARETYVDRRRASMGAVEAEAELRVGRVVAASANAPPPLRPKSPKKTMKKHRRRNSCSF